MWIMLNDAWLSIVADRDDPEYLLVRSRKRGAVADIFGQGEFEDVEADYQFRQFIHRDHVAGVMAREVQRVTYDNFKNSVKDPQLKSAYNQVWTVGWKMQLENQNKGVQRRALQPTITPNAADDLDLCSWCQEEIDTSFHAPEPGQPVDVCESCWSQNGEQVLTHWYEETREEKDVEAEQCFL